MVPSRMAMKVAPSTSALPAGNSSRARWSGRMPYLIGPNSEPITPNRNSANEQHRHRMQHEADHRDQRRRRSRRISAAARRSPCRSGRRSRRRAPDRKKNGAMKIAPASVISASRLRSADLEQDQEDQRVLQEVVVEGREELAPEQRREAPGQQERFGIGLGRGHGPHFMPMDCDGRQSRAPGSGGYTISGRTPASPTG